MKTSELSLQARFLGIDTRAIAVFRMALGLLLMADSLLRYAYLGELLSDAGAQSRESVQQWNPLFGLYFMHGSAIWSGLLLGITGLVGFLLALGWRPRLMVALGWFLIRCLHERTQVSMQGGDILLRFLLIWAIFLPLNAVWSVGKPRNSAAIPRRSVICNAATAALLAQTVIIYISSALTKSTDAWWTIGDLLWWDLQDPILTTSFGARLLAYPDLLPSLIRSGYLLEWLALPLAFFPWRTATIRILLVFTMWGFHLLGIGLIFNLALFPWISAASWIVFLPTSFWDKLERLFASASTIIPSNAEVPMITAMPKAATLLVTCILLGIVGWNASWIGIHRMGKKFPKWIADYARSVPIHQGWDLFCYALKNDTRLVVVGTTADGKIVDLQHAGSSVIWGQESLPPVTSQTYRWRRYISRISEPRFEEGSKHYGDYLCRRWEEQTGVPLVKAELWRVLQYRHPPDGTPPKPTEKNLFYTLNWREVPNNPAKP